MLRALDSSLHDCYLEALIVNVLRSVWMWITLDYITRRYEVDWCCVQMRICMDTQRIYGINMQPRIQYTVGLQLML